MEDYKQKEKIENYFLFFASFLDSFNFFLKSLISFFISKYLSMFLPDIALNALSKRADKKEFFFNNSLRSSIISSDTSFETKLLDDTFN